MWLWLEKQEPEVLSTETGDLQEALWAGGLQVVRGTAGAGQGEWSSWRLEEMSLSTGLESGRWLPALPLTPLAWFPLSGPQLPPSVQWDSSSCLHRAVLGSREQWDRPEAQDEGALWSPDGTMAGQEGPPEAFSSGSSCLQGGGGGQAVQEPAVKRAVRTVVPLLKGSPPQATNDGREEGCPPSGMNGQPESTQSMLGAGARDRTPKL